MALDITVNYFPLIEDTGKSLQVQSLSTLKAR